MSIISIYLISFSIFFVSIQEEEVPSTYGPISILSGALYYISISNDGLTLMASSASTLQILKNNGSGFEVLQSIPSSEDVFYTTKQMEVLAMTAAGWINLFRRTETGTYIQEENINCGDTVKALFISEDQEEIMCGLNNGSTKIFIKNETNNSYSFLQEIASISIQSIAEISQSPSGRLLVA